MKAVKASKRANARKTLRVADLMTRDVVTVRPEDELVRLRDVMAELDVRHLPVVDEGGDLVGLVSHRDLLRHALVGDVELPIGVQDDMLRKHRVSEIMNTEVETVAADVPLAAAARIMLDNKFGCLPVVDGAFLVGILTEADFVRCRAEES